MQDTVQLFTAQNGRLSAKAILPDGTFRHLHSLVDPAIEGEYYKELEYWGDIIVLAGLGLGYHLAPSVRNLPGNALVVAIDYHDELADFCRNNLFSGLKNHVVYLSSGNSADNAGSVAAIVRQKLPAKMQVIKHPASFELHRIFYESIIDGLLQSLTESEPAVRRPAVRRALLMHGKFFLEEEIAGALRQNGVDPVLFAYNELNSPVRYEDALMKRLQEQKPSVIVSVNMKGIDANGVFEGITRSLGIPTVVWFVDDPRRIVAQPLPTSPRRISQNIMAACWEKAYIPWLERTGFSKTLHLPLATDPSLFQTAATPSPSIGLGFAGTAMVDAFAGKIKEKFLWSESLAALADLASERLLADSQFDIDASLTDCANSLSISLPFSDAKNRSWLCAHIIHTASMKKRKRIVGGLLSEGIETFGDEAGWKSLLGPSVKTHPDIDYRRGLGDCYRSIRINVNITSCQMPTAVNQRVFDVPCAGSLVISDAQKDIYDLFEVDKEAILYESLEELKDKIRFYRVHETERRNIIAAAQKRILSEHTYAKRIGDMMRMI